MVKESYLGNYPASVECGLGEQLKDNDLTEKEIAEMIEDLRTRLDEPGKAGDTAMHAILELQGLLKK